MTSDARRRDALEIVDVMYLSRADEVANVLTHTIGFLLSIGVGVFFWNMTQDRPLGLRLTCIAFTVSLAAVYMFSTLSHLVYEPRRRHRMRAWDQGTIYLLIAGTYSPFIWEGSAGTWRVTLLTAVWSAAAFGFYSKVFSAYRVNAVSTITYIALGWFPAMALVTTVTWISVVWMILGGVSYTVGIIFLNLSDHIRFTHAVWHLMVMAGSACHCYAIYRLL